MNVQNPLSMMLPGRMRRIDAASRKRAMKRGGLQIRSTSRMRGDLWRLILLPDSLRPMSDTERRGFERVEYAPGERPLFLSGGESFEVVDCAERGIRVLPSREVPQLPEVGSDLHGTVRFPGGTEVPVEGVVVRVSGDGIAVNFTQVWIDKEVIERERRRLRGPGHFAP
jgi:hypothetical protein